MPAPDSLSSREKKTLRDRRAQVARRARQAAHIKQLEEQVEQCRREHAKEIQYQQELSTLRAALDLVTRECEELRGRQTAASNLLAPGRTVQLCHGQFDGSEHHPGRAPADHTETCEERTGKDWALLPSHAYPDDLVLTMTPWLLCPAVVEHLCDVPAAHDILSGSENNPLANSIHIAVTYAYSYKMADPERLAWGWILYLYTKWVLHPTPARYARLPHFLRPTELQRSCAHSPLIDFLVWPGIRDNLINAVRGKYDLRLALTSMVPNLKVSWPTHEPLLELDPTSSQLVFRQEFLNAISRLENWTITVRFVRDFPHIAGGIHWEPLQSSARTDNECSSIKRLRVIA